VSNPSTQAQADGPVRVLVLGSTGSIGTQALEVIAANPDRFEVVGLAAGGSNLDTLRRQRAETGVTNIAVADERAAATLGDIPFHGPDAVTRLVEQTEADVVLNALVGALGLRPTLAALHSGARLALANKESLIAGGPLVLRAAQPGQIVPVDSEHSALGRARRSRQVGVDRLGWAVPRLGRRRPGGRHTRAGRCPSDLVDGPDEHAELGVAG
jgi:1-deoxy-D-xylulose-5-phosphate reductoisomerase